jgi:short-subunit dehydrogenase
VLESRTQSWPAKTGQVATISSIGGIPDCNIAPSYNASKAYVSNYLEGLRKKALKSGFPITVTDIQPGFVDTPWPRAKGCSGLPRLKKPPSKSFKGFGRKNP